MAQDQQSYRRAANAALAGLIVQGLLAAIMGVAATMAESPAMLAATWHLLGGLPIWIVLMVLYHQHRLERAEALEAEQLGRADAATAAIFDEHGADLNIAKRRLDRLYKWGLPIVGVLVALYLLAVGALLFNRYYGEYLLVTRSSQRASGLTAIALDAENANTPVLFIVALVVFFVAFLVARYEAGMTKIREWQLLRGGATYLVGSSLISFVVAVGLGLLAFAREPRFLGAMGLVVPVVMMLLGFEVLLNQLLGIYRPRRAGEVARPAFDSRVFGLMTSPKSIARAFSDAVNYQFGFEVSKSWFYRLLGKAITPLIVFGGLLLLLLSSVVVVRPEEEAIVTRFGALVTPEPLQPGVHLKWPWPIGRATILPTRNILSISVGSSRLGIKRDTAILWTNRHTEGDEEYLITAPTPLPASGLEDRRAPESPGGTAGAPGAATAPAGPEADASTPHNSLIGGQVLVQFRIADMVRFVNAATEPRLLLWQVVEGEVNRYFASHDIDTLLGTRPQLGATAQASSPQPDASKPPPHESLKREIQAAVNELDLGLEIVAVSLSGVHPPSEGNVATAFQEQVGVLQEQQSQREQARRYAIMLLTQVAGSQERAREIAQAIEELKIAERALAAQRGGDDAARAAQEQAIATQQARIEALLTGASGEAASILAAAQAYRWQRSIDEQAEAERFAARLAAYRAAPDLYRQRRYLEVLAEGLGRVRKYVIAGDGDGSPAIRIDFNKGTAAGSVFNLED